MQKIIVKTEKEIETWFLNHSAGSVFVANKYTGQGKMCSSYGEAIKWHNKDLNYGSSRKRN